MRQAIILLLTILLAGCSDITKSIEDGLAETFNDDPIVGVWAQPNDFGELLPAYFVQEEDGSFDVFEVGGDYPVPFVILGKGEDGTYSGFHPRVGEHEWVINEEGNVVNRSWEEEYVRWESSVTTLDGLRKEMDAMYKDDPLLGVWGMDDGQSFEPFFFVEKQGYSLRLTMFDSFKRDYFGGSQEAIWLTKSGEFYSGWHPGQGEIEMSVSGDEVDLPMLLRFSLFRGETEAETMEAYLNTLSQ